MRVLLLTQLFQPEQFAKGLPFARELVRRGHQVQVLTGFPHYPGGKIYDGYRVRAWQRESIEGIPVTRVPVYPSHDRSAINRIMTYASFMISAAILGPALTRPADVVYVYHPPITVGLAAVAFKRLWRTPFVIDIQDLWPDTLEATGMMSSPGMLDSVSRICRIVYRNAARIIVLSQGFARALADRGVPLERITVIHNWSLEGDLRRQVELDLAARLGMDQRFNVVFAGTFGLAQHLDTVLDAARLLQDSFPRIQFVLIGTGLEEARLRRRAETERIANVRFLGWRPATEVGQAMAISDALLVHLKDDPLFAITIPSKTQAYLAIGRPIIMAVRGDAAQMVSEAGAGLNVEPEDPSGLADAVVALYRMPHWKRLAMGRNGRAYYDTRLALPVGVDKFERIFATVVEEACTGRHSRE